jgi:hypothetical protein
MGCKPNVAKTYIDKDIPEHTKSEIKVLNEKLFRALKDNNKQEVTKLFSTGLVKAMSIKLDSFMYIAHHNIVETNSFSVTKEFYIVNSTDYVSNTILSGLTGEYDYTFHYLAINKEMYIVMIVPDTEPDQMLITCIYGKYPEGWKINIIQLGLYQKCHKNAIDLYKEAQKEYEKGYIVDAGNTLFILQSCLYPANDLMHYNLEGKIKDFYKSVQTESRQKYVFPYELKAIKSKPTVISISPQIINECNYPLVEYLTQIQLTDTTNLRKENDEIQKLIGGIYRGIDKEKKFLIYRAWNKMPDGKTQLPTYVFTKRLN